MNTPNPAVPKRKIVHSLGLYTPGNHSHTEASRAAQTKGTHHPSPPLPSHSCTHTHAHARKIHRPSSNRYLRTTSLTGDPRNRRPSLRSLRAGRIGYNNRGARGLAASARELRNPIPLLLLQLLQKTRRAASGDKKSQPASESIGGKVKRIHLPARERERDVSKSQAISEQCRPPETEKGASSAEF